jgi:hypothetical protein
MATRTGLTVLAVTLAIALPAAAQPSRAPFSDLGRYLDPGDSVYVVTKAEGEVQGRLEAVTPTSLRVAVDGTTRDISVGDIGWIDRVPDRWWDGAIGGGIGGYAFTFGVAALFCVGGDGECSDSVFTDPGMHRTALKMGGVWAAMFGLVDLIKRDRSRVYGVRPGAAREQLRQRPPVTSVAELWSQIRPDDRVVVRRLDGTEVAGRFQSVSADSITVRAGGRQLEMPAPQVARVFRRTSRLREGLLIGPALGAAYGGLHPAREDRRADSVVTGALLGWAFGSALGMAVPRRSTVFDARPARTIAAAPVLSRQGFGLVASVRF